MTSQSEHAALAQCDGVVTVLIRLIGEAATLKLLECKHLGGGIFLFPKSELHQGAQSYAYLVDIVGVNNTQRLVAYFNGEEVYLPKLTQRYIKARNKRIVLAYNNGKSLRELIREFELCDRQLRKILKYTDMTDAVKTVVVQESLF
ncbi:MAG: hypothetical protein K2P84_13490 [Undibacterium sp.]|nr:hypothetical protein [Undibacterium sp.]